MIDVHQVSNTHTLALHDLRKQRSDRIRARLLTWYCENARVLPWRVPSAPFASTMYTDYVDRLYKCLLSETMLQQTQVKTVIAYYTKWLIKFPTLTELAAAKEEDVMACWAGLGYYSRAKRLHQAAQYLFGEFVTHGLEFPTDVEHWIKKVPGVGPYTAGAILSISFGVPSPIIDGNVQRVLSRILAVHGDTSTPKGQGSKLLWERAAQLVDGDRPGDLNQALMELGATVCSPTLPNCTNCPVNNDCQAYQQSRHLKRARPDFFRKTQPEIVNNSTPPVDLEDLCTICPASVDPSIMLDKPEVYIQSLYPFKPQKKAQREETAIVMIVRKDGEIYLEKKEKGLLGGLFDFPTLLLHPDEAPHCDSLVEKHKEKLAAVYNGTTTHLFTHIRRTSHVLVCDHSNAQKALAAFLRANETGRWIAEDAIADLGVSELCLKNWRLGSGVEKPKKRKDAQAPMKQSLKKQKKPEVGNQTTSVDSSIALTESNSATNMQTVVSNPNQITKQASPTSQKVSDGKTAKQSKIFAMFERKKAR